MDMCQMPSKKRFNHLLFLAKGCPFNIYNIISTFGLLSLNSEQQASFQPYLVTKIKACLKFVWLNRYFLVEICWGYYSMDHLYFWPHSIVHWKSSTYWITFLIFLWNLLWLNIFLGKWVFLIGLNIYVVLSCYNGFWNYQLLLRYYRKWKLYSRKEEAIYQNH